MAHLPAEPSICDRCDRFRRSRSAIRRRPRMDHASCPVRHQGAGMASLAGLSSHRRPCARCGRVALPIVQIGASPKGVACPAPPRPTPQRGTHWTWPVDDFHRIAQGHHRDASCPAFGARSSAIARRAKRTTIPLRRLHCASATNNSKHCKKLAPKSKDLQSLSLPGDPAAIRLSRTRL
jgi:hypothetical protein